MNSVDVCVSIEGAMFRGCALIWSYLFEELRIIPRHWSNEGQTCDRQIRFDSATRRISIFPPGIIIIHSSLGKIYTRPQHLAYHPNSPSVSPYLRGPHSWWQSLLPSTVCHATCAWKLCTPSFLCTRCHPLYSVSPSILIIQGSYSVCRFDLYSFSTYNCSTAPTGISLSGSKCFTSTLQKVLGRSIV